jgi:hypothetical protein
MYNGGKFDRKILNTAALAPVPVIMEKVEVIKRGWIEVPMRWKMVSSTSELPGPAAPLLSVNSAPDLHSQHADLQSASAPSLVDTSSKTVFSVPIEVFVPPVGLGPFPILVRDLIHLPLLRQFPFSHLLPLSALNLTWISIISNSS